MPPARPRLYFDLGSPYAYLAFERAPAVLGVEPELRPILLGAIFARRGFGSWAQTPARAARVAELQERAARYGLAPMTWPPGWPGDGLTAMRCATWALREGAGVAFARAAFRAQFAEGAEIADASMLAGAAEQAGLDPDEMSAAIATSAVKQALRDASEAAWEAGVRGVPSLAVEGALLYGDDQLELAAAALAGRG